jgi:hypothetical protein
LSIFDSQVVGWFFDHLEKLDVAVACFGTEQDTGLTSIVKFGAVNRWSVL